MKNKKLVVMAVTALLAIGSAMTAFAGQWQQDEKGWRYQNDDGSYVAQDGIYDNGNLYRFDENGYMVTGWLFRPMNLSQMDAEYKQEMMEATHGYGGYWSYYGPDGSMVWYNYTPEGYWIEASGFWDFRDANPAAAERKKDSTNNPTPIEQQEIPEDGFNYEYAEEVFELVNEAREEAGVEPLEMTDELNAVAEIRAKELVTKFSHLRPDGSLATSIMNHDNHILFGENIAKGSLNPNGVMLGWMNSPDHKENLLDKDYDQLGIACYIEDGVSYWVQFFAKEK